MSIGLLAGGRAASAPDGIAAEVAALQQLLSARGARHLLSVAQVPANPAGYARLRALVARRSANELVAVVQRAPAPGHELIWGALAGLGPGASTLTSQSTEQRGLIAATDLAPTILAHLRIPIPASMRGRAVRTDGPLDGAWLRDLKLRLEAIYPRRLPALACLLGVWALLAVLASLPRARGVTPARRTPRRTPRFGRHERWSLRVGALAMLWTPVAVLVPAALEPGAAVEYTLIAACCFALATLTDVLLPWPRAPVAPALVAVLALSVDALAHTQLLTRSLLGPDPAHGARFFGIGNELKSGLAVLVFAAVAAALHPTARSRRAALAMAGAGTLLAVVEGSALIGAGVGGTVLVCAGAAVAATMLLPGPALLPEARLAAGRRLAVVAAPVLGLAVLAALDLATAHGSGHFTGSVLDARSAADVWELVERRYATAWSELASGLMPVAAAVTVLVCMLAIRRRERVLAPVRSDPAWRAALAGGLTAGVVGALVEDSGPVLLLVAAFALACVVAYLWGKPTTVQIYNGVSDLHGKRGPAGKQNPSQLATTAGT